MNPIIDRDLGDEIRDEIRDVEGIAELSEQQLRSEVCPPDVKLGDWNRRQFLKHLGNTGRLSL